MIENNTEKREFINNGIIEVRAAAISGLRQTLDSVGRLVDLYALEMAEQDTPLLSYVRDAEKYTHMLMDIQQMIVVLGSTKRWEEVAHKIQTKEV